MEMRRATNEPLVARTDDLERLTRDGLVEAVDGRRRTTRRWKAAMVRAAVRLRSMRDPPEELWAPVVLALVDRYGDALDEDELVRLVLAMGLVEAEELGLRPSVRTG